MMHNANTLRWFGISRRYQPTQSQIKNEFTNTLLFSRIIAKPTITYCLLAEKVNVIFGMVFECCRGLCYIIHKLGDKENY